MQNSTLWLLLTILLSLLASCDSIELLETTEDCSSCGKTEYFLESYNDTLLTHYSFRSLDTLSSLVLLGDDNQEILNLCFSYDMDTIEYYKKVIIAGSIYENCNDSSSLPYNHIQIDDFHTLEHCSPQVDTIPETFSLDRSWIVYYLEIDSKKVLPPCESQGRAMSISSDSLYLNYGNCDMNIGITGNILKCNGIEVCLLEIINYNETQRLFSSQINDILDCGTGSDLKINIENNFLNVTNQNSGNSIVLYTSGS